jgi:hypothetical protein
MRAAAIPGVLALASLTVPLGCGAAQQPVQGGPDSSGTSARFIDVTVYEEEGEQLNEVTKGAFDWATGEGWAEWSYGGGPPGSLLQVGADCFQRDAGQQWKHWRSEDNPPYCTDEFFPPAELLAGLRSSGALESEREEEVRGAKTTHYRVVPKDEYADDPEQWIDVWLDEEGLVHKLNRPEGEASPRTRDYFDFGVDVDVNPPCRPVPPGSHPSTTLSRDSGKPPCVEETG